MVNNYQQHLDETFRVLADGTRRAILGIGRINALSPKTHAHRAIVAGKDAVILKTISPPSMAEFDELIRKARRQARKASVTQSDIDKAIAAVRDRR